MSLPYMAFYPADFLAKTMHLCPMQAGAYMFLICHYWEHGGLPSNARALSRIARLTPEQWEEHCPTLQAFFHDGWKHSRIDQEIGIAKERHEKRVSAGRRGGISKASNATAMLQQCSSNQNQNHKEEREEVESATSSADSSKGQPRKYAFEYGCIRLTQSHYDAWVKAYPLCDLEAELIALEPWAASTPNWFHAIPNRLAKISRAAKERIAVGEALANKPKEDIRNPKNQREAWGLP